MAQWAWLWAKAAVRGLPSGKREVVILRPSGGAGVQRPEGDLLKSGALDTKPTQFSLTAGQVLEDGTARVSLDQLSSLDLFSY